MARRPTIPARLQKSVFQAYGCRCALCSETEISTLEIHHVDAWSVVREHRFENLILVCANCHSRIESGAISKEEAKSKQVPENRAQPAAPAQPGNVIAFSGGSNSGIIANNLTIKTARGTKSATLPLAGTIGTSAPHRNYIKYLIDRYHKFKEGEVGKTAMRYQVLYASVRREFGAKWDHIPFSRFDQLCHFLHKKIESTKVGRIERSHGNSLFRDFGQYNDHYGSTERSQPFPTIVP